VAFEGCELLRKVSKQSSTLPSPLTQLRVPTEPAPHTAKLLDTFLRIVSPAMTAGYGSHYMAVMIIVSERVLPKLSENNSFVQSQAHKLQLQDFISTFLLSNGETCLPVLADM
jgi:hypothetical protein